MGSETSDARSWIYDAASKQAIDAARGAGAERIERLTFHLFDPTGHVTPEIVETLFLALSDGTIAQGASLVVEPQARFSYTVLGAVRNSRDRQFGLGICPTCQRPGMPTRDVPEFSSESIDVDG